MASTGNRRISPLAIGAAGGRDGDGDGIPDAGFADTNGNGLPDRFLYTGMSEPVFLLKGRSPDDWEGWLNAIWEEMGEPEDYLTHPSLVEEEVVGDYSLTSPYEWYGDTLAYVVTVLEETALERIAARGTGPEVEAAQEAAKERLVEPLRAVWPGFYHRNIGKEVRACFGETFPIREDDRQLLVERYILPIVER